VFANYTSEVMAQRYAELYDQVLGQPAAVAAGARVLDVGKARGQ
jgi:hypothetical protein